MLPVPELLTVIVRCASEPTATAPKSIEVGVTVTPGVVPVPLKVAVMVAGFPSVVTASVADAGPACVGANATLIVQFAFTANDAGQLLFCTNGAGIEMLEIASPSVPRLLNVIGRYELVVPAFCPVHVCPCDDNWGTP